MIYDTAGNRIHEPIRTCNCGLTGGCSLCNPVFNGVSYPIMEKEKDGKFEIGQIATEATAESYVYHKVGYAVCRKCGEI